jgi:sugar phosphate isomerase/epimerase
VPFVFSAPFSVGPITATVFHADRVSTITILCLLLYNPSIMNRRTFIQNSLATAALTSLPARALADTHQIPYVGLQLYTVRDEMKKDLPATITRVATIGYKEVEFAGYFNHSPADIRAVLDKNRLTAPSCHIPLDALQNQLPQTIDAAHIIGHTYIINPWIDEKLRQAPDGWKKVADQFNQIGAATKKAGIQFGYHNHTFEFVPDPNIDGKLPYDFLLDNTDKDLVKMEMDLCWISVTGHDPVSYFNRYPGRFPLVHVKDVKEMPKVVPGKTDEFVDTEFEKKVMTEPGSGVIDWKRIFAHADQAGVQHYFVEHDSPADPFASITASYKYLSTLRF